MVALKVVRPTIACSSSSSGSQSGLSVPLHKFGFVKMPLPAPSPSLLFNGGNNARFSLVLATEDSTLAVTNGCAAVIPCTYYIYI